jgi:alpha 1,2-mannosyltransferase
MRWSQTRLIATAIISLFTIISFLSWNRNNIPDYLPKEAQNYFHPDETQNVPPDHAVREFVLRSILTYDDSVKLNSETCPTKGINFDAGNVRDSEQKWRDIPSARISDWRHDIAAHLDFKHREQQEKLNSGPSVVKDGQSERGIVMAAGAHDAVIRARTNIRFLRSYNCTLPIEIFHFPGEISGPDKNLVSELSQLEVSDGHGHIDMKVTVRVVEGLEKGNGWKAYHIKGAAIQQSSFDEILYLDTDSYPLRNPEYLFEGEHWKETGLLLWPDYTKSHPTNPLWRLIGQQCRNEYEGESGQILISRSRHQEMLWVVEYFAVHRGEFYGFMGGDRDSFRVAALLLGKKWTGPGRLNAAAGVELKDNPRGGSHTMLQADPEGRWMFVHANLIKHGHFPRPLWQRIHRAVQDTYEGTSTYGSIDTPNENLGEGVKLRVDQAPNIVTTMEAFEGYDEALVIVEEWNAYEELRGFEEKWFGFGGEH